MVKRAGKPGRPFRCRCCTPPRQLYYQARGRVELARHEDDHTPATAAVSLAAQRRMLREVMAPREPINPLFGPM